MEGPIVNDQCRRCQRETTSRALTGDPLCAECAQWAREHEESRTADQHGLGDFETNE